MWDVAFDVSHWFFRRYSSVAHRKICTAVMDLFPPTFTGKLKNLYILGDKKQPPLGTFSVSTVGPPGPVPCGGLAGAPKGQFQSERNKLVSSFHHNDHPKPFATTAKVLFRSLYLWNSSCS